ncbi:MAG: hypothetical protein VX154_03730 [Pseudomonadota bacterium]|nr:hypothetical protein [Pseudomonadota bacterium]
MRNQRRRDFFASLAEASLSMLGENAFHGSLDEVSYTFVPSNYRNKPTLLVAGGLRLKEGVYKDHFNLIYMDKWPTNQRDVSFWRRLLLRHDLTDQMFVLCKTLPESAPSFMMKAICLDKNSVARMNRNLKTLPVMLLVGEDKAHNMPTVDHYGHGSDLFVSNPNLLNVEGSMAFNRLMQFFDQV